MRSTFNENKRDALLMYITEHKIDIVGPTETWGSQLCRQYNLLDSIPNWLSRQQLILSREPICF